MDVIHELRWARWGPMVVREIQGDQGPLKILTPEHGQAKRKGYDLHHEKRPLLDDLLAAADSNERHAMMRSAWGAGEKLGAQRIRRADEIHERDIAAAASRWGFLMPEVYVDEDRPGRPLFEPLHLWDGELLNLRFAWDLCRTGGNLSSLSLRLYAHTLVDQPPIERGASEGRLDEHGFWWKPGQAASAIRSDKRAESARGLLEQALARQLSRGDVEIVVKGERYALRPKSLIAAAWLELGSRVLRALPEKTCPQCGNPFVPATVRRVFCSEKCKDDSKNARRTGKKKTRRTR